MRPKILRATKIPDKIDFSEGRRIAGRRAKSGNLERFVFNLPADEEKLGRRYSHLKNSGFSEVNLGRRYLPKDFKTGEKIVLFIRRGNKIYERSGRVMDLCCLLLNDVGLSLRLERKYFLTNVPISSYSYRKIEKVFKKNENIYKTSCGKHRK